jgi:hypothetical protein
MRNGSWTKSLAGLVVVSLLISLCAGCEGMKYHEIYMTAAGGAVVGWIVGHQYDEDGWGAAAGAAAFGFGDFLKQLDNLPQKPLEEAAKDVSEGNSLLSRGVLSPSALTQAGW